jgi:hypothetical protein
LFANKGALDTVFIASNLEGGLTAEEKAANQDDGLIR